nr:MAG TPA: hypothetical protein [Crassvirales sp.]
MSNPIRRSKLITYSSLTFSHNTLCITIKFLTFAQIIS